MQSLPNPAHYGSKQPHPFMCHPATTADLNSVTENL